MTDLTLDSRNMYSDIIRLISENRLNAAIELLLQHFQHFEVINQSARLKKLQENINLGTITAQDAAVTERKIREAVFNIAGDMRNQYSTKHKKKVLSKLHHLATLLRKGRKAKWLALWSLLMIFNGDIVKKMLVLIAAGFLVLAGASFVIYIDSSLEILGLNFELAMQEKSFRGEIKGDSLRHVYEVEGLNNTINALESQNASILEYVNTLKNRRQSAQLPTFPECDGLVVYLNEEITSMHNMGPSYSAKENSLVYQKLSEMLTQIRNSQ